MGNWPPREDPFSENVKDLREEIQTMQNDLSTYCKTGSLRIVLCGEVGAGKSSVINNIMTAFRGKVVQTAVVGDEKQHVTTRYTEYKVRVDVKEDDRTLLICDTRGIDISSPEEMIEVMKEAVVGRYFSDQTMTAGDLEMQSCRKRQAIYIIIVVDATRVKDETNSDWSRRFISIKDFANTNAISRAVFLTKCDRIDAKVNGNIRNLYKSERVEWARNMISKTTGVLKNRIFPIVNYTDEMTAEPPMMLQTLYALKHIVNDVESLTSDVVREV